MKGAKVEKLKITPKSKNMGSGFKINENLVSQLSLLAAGSSCVALGGLGGTLAVGFGIFAAPAIGVGAWGLTKWMKRFQTKDPTAHRTIKKIQSRINKTLTGDSRFADMDDEMRGDADKYLPKLLSDFWPTPKIIAELASDLGGFPKAIAEHILDEINGAVLENVSHDFFEDGHGRNYAELIITIALEASLEDEDYFKKLEPQVLMQNLQLTGQIQRDVEQFFLELETIKYCLGELLSLTKDIRKTQLADSEKIDAMFRNMGLSDTDDISPEVKEGLRKNVIEMLSSERLATQDAVKELMAEPPNPVAATNRLKQAIAEQSDAQKEAASNQIEMWQEIATINYFNNGKEAVEAYQEVLKLSPNDANNWNQLGLLQMRLGDLDASLSAYQKVGEIAGTQNDDALRAVSFGNMGIVAQTRGDLDAAMAYYEQALEIDIALGRQEGVAIRYANMGVVAQICGDLDAAMGYYQQSLEIEKALGRQEGMAINYTNMGNVAQTRGDLDAAMAYYEQALEINEALGLQEGMAIDYGNMGVVAQTRSDLDAAMGYYEQALEINTALGRQEGIAIRYGNMGIVAQTRGDLAAAMAYYEQALEINTALGSKEGMAFDYGNMGIVAETRGDLDAAKELWQKSLDLFTEVGATPRIAQVQGWLDALES